MAIVREDGVSISTTDAAPTHFIFKIHSLSYLEKHDIDKYTSAQFEAGGYKWKLIFYPNGNKRKRAADHISMHLAIADTSGFQAGWEVHAVFRLFLLDQNNDTYFVIQDADTQEKGRRFRATMTEWGFDRIIPLKTFNDPSYGYVVDDVCVWGAEVYVHKELKFPVGQRRFPKGECLSMFKDPAPVKHDWTIEKFSTLEYHKSDPFQQWRIGVYPNGKDGMGTYLSFTFHLDVGNESKEKAPSRVYAEFTLRVIDRHHHKNPYIKDTAWLSPSTHYERLKAINKDGLKRVFKPSSKDKCTIEAEVRVYGETTPLL